MTARAPGTPRPARPVRGPIRRMVYRPRRYDLGAFDATIEPDPGPAPEAVFDRVTGPYACDEEP